MPGKFSYTPLAEYEKEEDIPKMVVAINEVFSRIKEAFDVLGMCFGYRCSVTTGAASSDAEVEHNLGVVPDGFAIVSSSMPCRVWEGNADWTATSLFIQADKANVSLNLLVFVDTN